MKLLLGIGGSEDSMRALERTVVRAADAGDHVTIAILDNPESDRTREEIETEVDRVLAEHDFEAEVRFVDGDPGGQLVKIAEDEGFDRIVLGGGQRSPMGKINMGSIAEFVVLNARTTVTLVR